jgi:integrase
MPARHRLTSLAVRNAGPGKVADGGGHWLVKSSKDSGKWVLRLTVFGRRREMGLGSISDVPLKQAREQAERWRAVLAEGRDPIAVRASEKLSASRADTRLSTMAAGAFDARKAELKGDGASGRWFSPLELHVLPRLGRTPIQEIDQRLIRDCLAPIWHEKGETARKALNRLGIVLRHAAALGLEVDLQATTKAAALLGRSRRQSKHIPAMPWQDVPEFYSSIEEPTVTHLALRLLILTGVRSRPIRFFRLEQIEGDVWMIPAELMKGARSRTSDSRVPLNAEALRLIDLTKPHERDGFLFPSIRKGVISDATMSRLMERRGHTDSGRRFGSGWRRRPARPTRSRRPRWGMSWVPRSRGPTCAPTTLRSGGRCWNAGRTM